MAQPLGNHNSITRMAEAPPPGFTCSASQGALASVWMRAAGELDLAAAPQLTQVLRDAVIRARLLVLDLRELTFIDSSGVHAIVDACVRAERARCRVAVIEGAPQVRRVFRVDRPGSLDRHGL